MPCCTAVGSKMRFKSGSSTPVNIPETGTSMTVSETDMPQLDQLGPKMRSQAFAAHSNSIRKTRMRETKLPLKRRSPQGRRDAAPSVPPTSPLGGSLEVDRRRQPDLPRIAVIARQHAGPPESRIDSRCAVQID